MHRLESNQSKKTARSVESERVRQAKPRFELGIFALQVRRIDHYAIPPWNVRYLQGLNLRSHREMDFKSIALTTRPRYRGSRGASLPEVGFEPTRDKSQQNLSLPP